MKTVYLLLAIVGGILPWAVLLPHYAANDPHPALLIQAMFANSAVAAMSTDLLFSSAVFWVVLAHRRVRRAWLYVILNLTLGLSCALPAYLYVREKRT